MALAKEETPDGDSYRYLKTFTDVLSLIERNYVTEVKVPDLIEGAIKGMLLSLDPHSSYMDADTYKDLQVETKGEFGGLGIEITVRDGLLTVVSPIEGSPAARVGVQAGDQIIKIGDEFTREMSLVDAVKKMRGPKGSPITISVHRENFKDLINFTIVRDIIRVKSVKSRMLDNGYGYIRLIQFQEDSSDEFEAALKDLRKRAGDKEIKGLVLDLRNDPGGLLTQAIRIADLFLTEGLIVYTDGRLESQKQKYFAHNDGNEPEFPLVVLVNNGSASASEIVAGALQDAGRAIIVGTQSFGKGSVQTILPMENGSALRLTTALYYTRGGRSIQAQGISPDVVVQPKKENPEDLQHEELAPIQEKDLPGALKNPKGEAGEQPKSNGANGEAGKQKAAPKVKPDPMTMDLPALLQDDPQLAEALKVLKNWDEYKAKQKPASSAANT